MCGTSPRTCILRLTRHVTLPKHVDCWYLLLEPELEIERKEDIIVKLVVSFGVNIQGSYTNTAFSKAHRCYLVFEYSERFHVNRSVS